MRKGNIDASSQTWSALDALGRPIARRQSGPSGWTLITRLLRFALPATLIMLLSGTSLVVDTYFVTKLGSAAVAGVSLVFPMYLMLVMAFGGGIGVGISVVLSVRLGRGDAAAAQRAVGSAFAVAIGFALAVTIAFMLGGNGLFACIASAGPVREAATSFARPIFLGAPIIAVSLTISNVLRSEQRLQDAAVMLLVSTGVNAALNPILIHGYFGAPAMGVAGAGLATILGFLVSAVLGAFYLLGGRSRRLTLGAAALRFDGDDALAIARIALPTLGTYAATNTGLMALSIVWTRFGTDELAAFGLASRLEYLVTIAIYGVGSAILTLGGEARGAGEHRELARLCWIAAAGVVLLNTFLAAVLMTRPATWFRMFGATSSVVDSGVGYMLISAPAYPFHALALILNYAYQTIGQAKLPLLWSLLRWFAIAVPFAAVVAAFGGSAAMAAIGVTAAKMLFGVVTGAYLPSSLRRARSLSLSSPA